MSPAESRRILIHGDSLSAGYGIRAEESWPALLQERIGSAWKVCNTSLSGETTAGGLRRLPSALATHRPAVVVLELGANDAFSGLSLQSAADNLVAMCAMSKLEGARVMVIAMDLPPMFEAEALAAFREMFATVARKAALPNPPSLLAGLFSDSANFLADLIHPSARAQPKILANVWPTIEAMLTSFGP